MTNMSMLWGENMKREKNGTSEGLGSGKMSVDSKNTKELFQTEDGKFNMRNGRRDWKIGWEEI